MIRRLLVIALIATSVAPRSHAQTLPEAFRKIFASPTPAPAHRKRKTTSSPTKPKQGSPTPTPSPRPKKKKSDEASPTPTPAESPSATPSPSAKAKRKKKAQEASPTPTATPSETPTAAPSASVAPPPEKKKGAPATVPPEQIAEYPNYPPNVRKIADLSLDLTRRNLEYKYGSADPANGGMDCSGFVYYVLTQSGVPDVPRDSSQQYVAVRKAGTFRAVNSRRDDSFELDELRPGDLLFWTGTYSIERDPPITHSMIYLGREKGSNKRIMVGASDGRVYNGESRFGVSVFDFKIAQPPRDNDAKLHPMFIGYAHVPGLQH